MHLEFLRLEPSQIDAADESFRVRRRHPEKLLASVASSGIRTPLLVERREPRFRLVSGWGRWLARPEGVAVPCFILPAGSTLEAAWDALLRDNDAWNVMEIARVLRGLSVVPGLTEARVIAEKLPLLGVHASRDLYRRHWKLLELGPEAQSFVEEEGLPLRKAATLFKLPPDALELLLIAVRDLGFSFNDVSETIELVEEIAHREAAAPAALIADARARASSRGELRQLLRERRFPQLTAHRQRIRQLERELKFRAPVRIEWDARLERPGIQLVADLADTEALEDFERDLILNRDALRRILGET